jgi:hypothetical protein
MAQAGMKWIALPVQVSVAAQTKEQNSKLVIRLSSG